ncbi:MAG: NAD-dependent malic enzyme [Actinomycetota bacterium]|jgi:malate dehydrogenase (oxaloacetate-decarboxylating)|nr:NAD-dependent malic enzyme [Actinomycetota bacterium]
MARARFRDASPSYSTTVRLEAPSSPHLLSDLARSTSDRGGEVVAIDLVEATVSGVRVDVTFNAIDERHVDVIAEGLRSDGYVVRNVSDRTFLSHLGGTIEVVPRSSIRTRDDLSLVYTPGVARIARTIAAHADTAWNLTGKGNSVAVVTDGSAVLGLGDVGPLAALPVMEGKAALFKAFANVNAFPLCLATTDPAEIVAAVRAVAPGFGGINLEDIAAPRCFEIEATLQDVLDIPVFHDDQHGTAVVVLAGLVNACRITGRRLEDLRAVVIGIGAAGTAISKILLDAGVSNLVAVDRHGPLDASDPDLPAHHREIASRSRARQVSSVEEALAGADLVVGVSRRGAWDPAALAKMAPDPIIFALANPEPEVYLDEIPPGALLATGRSDLPNQVNNALAFPGIFRGAMDARAARITGRMQEAAARAIAEAVSDAERGIGVIVPSLFQVSVHAKVATAVEAAAGE